MHPICHLSCTVCAEVALQHFLRGFCLTYKVIKCDKWGFCIKEIANFPIYLWDHPAPLFWTVDLSGCAGEVNHWVVLPELQRGPFVILDYQQLAGGFMNHPDCVCAAGCNHSHHINFEHTNICNHLHWLKPAGSGCGRWRRDVMMQVENGKIQKKSSFKI